MAVNKNKMLMGVGMLVLAVGAYFLFIYDGGQSASEGARDGATEQTGEMDAVDQEIAARRDKALREQANPAEYIHVTIDPKRNLFGESVIEGKLENRAELTRYKDMEVMFYWQDEAGMVMDSAAEVLFGELDAGESMDFKTKRKGPRKSKSIQVKLRTAQARER